MSIEERGRTADDDGTGEPGPRLRFAPFTYDVATGELVGDEGGVVRLEPQPAKVLALLAGRAGQLVTREELQREVWPDGTFVDFKRGLNYCVAKIRAALGDDAARPRFIETLPRRGYRFVAAVGSARGARPEPSGHDPDEIPAADPAEPLAVPASSLPSTRPATLPPGVILALGVAIATAFGVIAWLARHSAPDKPTIAVARFDNETRSGELEPRAQSATDSIVVGLSQPPAAWEVIGNAAILRTSRSFRDLAAIRSALDADAIVLGQIQGIDGRYRVVVHLIRARDEKHLWADLFPVGEGGWVGAEQKAVAAVRAAVETHHGDFR